MAERQLTLQGKQLLKDKIKYNKSQNLAEEKANEKLRYLTKKSKNSIRQLEQKRKKVKNIKSSPASTKKMQNKKSVNKTAKKTPKKKETVSYYALTRTGYYGFISTLPLLIIYQVMAFYINKSFLIGARSGAEAWILALFSLLGAPGFILLGCIGGGLIVYFYLQKKKKNIPDIKSFYVLMLIESVVYSFFFGAFVMRILKFIMPGMILQMGMPLSKWQAVMMSLGAGYFEELVFRVILYGGLLYLIMYTAKILKPKSDLKTLKVFAMIILGVITALAFSFAHHLSGEPFSIYAFWFRAISGIIFVVLYQLRGFGVAAYTHAFYDLWIVIEAV